MKKISTLLLCVILGFDMLAISIFRSYAEEQKIIFDGKSLLMSGKMEGVVRRKNKLAFFMKLNPASPIDEWIWPEQSEIFVMNADGSDLKRLTFSDKKTDNVYIKWIDDKTIAFRRYSRGNPSIYLKINIDDRSEEEISEEYYNSIEE